MRKKKKNTANARIKKLPAIRLQFGEAKEVKQSKRGKNGYVLRRRKCVIRFLAVVEVSFLVVSMCALCDAMTLPVRLGSCPLVDDSFTSTLTQRNKSNIVKLLAIQVSLQVSVFNNSLLT